jgi:SAM-dependent methyltransferase
MMKRKVKHLLGKIPFVSAIVRSYYRIPHGPRGVRAVGHREYVGGLWEELGRLQLDFLIQEGLKPHHYLLDIGCGSLRAGVHFIPYLEKEHYLGIDKEEVLINLGLRNELSERVRIEKRPRLIVSDSFDFEGFGVRPDFALAQSLFTHLPPGKIHECLRALREVIRDSGCFLATFFESSEPVGNPKTPHDHAQFRYTREQMEEFGRSNQWCAEYVGDWNHPRGQVIVKYLPG